MNAHTELSGRYKLVKRKASDLENVTQEFEFANVITDIGLDRWGVGAIGSRCVIGSGNTPPAVTDTGLAAQLAVTSNNVTLTTWRAYSEAERWTEVTVCFRFTPGVALNSIAEVGVGWDTGLWSRALIRDGGGNPTTLQLLADEVLDVYYTLRMQFPADIIGSITLDGATYDWVMRPNDIDNTPAYASNWFSSAYGSASGSYWMMSYSQDTIGSVVSAPSGHASVDTVTPAPYVAGSKKQRVTYVANLGTANFPIKAVIARPAGSNYATVEWQLGFFQGGTPVGVPKTSFKRLSLTFDFSWGRA